MILYINIPFGKRIKNCSKVILLLLVIVFYSEENVAQGIVNVDAFRGRAQVSVPIYTLNKGEVSIPVSLDYIASGVRITDEGKECGVGWGLNAGGSISRRLRDLPDDKTAGGWLFGNSATSVASFAIGNDSNLSTCVDESTDINFLSANLPVSKDAEPDLFEVLTPGISCSIVFDKDHKPRTIPYNDFKISYTADSYGINSFTIVNDNGMVYYFAVPDLTSKTTITSKPVVPYFNREYSQYKTKVQYYSTWYLQKITDARGNSVALSYVNKSVIDSDNPVKVIERNVNGAFINNELYSVRTQVTPKQLTKIDGGTNNGYLGFTYNGSSYALETISVPGGDLFSFWYSDINSRLFLKTITNFSCSPNSLYKFNYIGENSTDSIITLPSTSSAQQDPWGFYNAGNDTILTPKIYVYPTNGIPPYLNRYRCTPIPGYTGASFILPGADRVVNPASVIAGVLSKVTYPTGGSTTIEYESNTYFDADIHDFQNGGGIRVKKITDHDGLDISKNVVKEYSYNNPGTLLTSGKIITMPSMAFTRAYDGSRGTQAYWEFSTVRSASDLSIESTDVIYNFVTIRQAGLGKIVQEYSSPATYWDQPSIDWAPSMSYYGRESCGTGPIYTNMGDLITNTNTYPYAMNTNYAFERGLIKSITIYNENNNPVTKEEFTYQRTNTPYSISGLRIDNVAGLQAYSKYNILTSTGNLITAKINSAFDLNDASKVTETKTSFIYESPNHKKATKSSVINSDGVINNSYVKYAKDYAASSSNDIAINGLQGLNTMNSNALIETYNSVIRPGELEKFVTGKLSTYKAIPANGSNSAMYVPWQSFRFINNSGDFSFQPSQITAQGAFVKDIKYTPVINYETYHQNGLPSTISSADKTVISYHFKANTGLSSTKIINAKYNQVISSGFDNDDSETSFSLFNPSYTLSARTGSVALSAPAGYTFQKTINKGNAKNYVLSCWIKSTSKGSLDITLTNTNNITAAYVLSHENSDEWKYYEIIIPVATMTNYFTIKVQNNVAIVIDDVLFYPENAQLTSFTYDINGHKLSETTTNGLAIYYEYDKQGKLKLVRDQDLNIIRKEFNFPFNKIIAGPYIDYSGEKVEGDNVTFSTPSDGCISGFTYTWSFGDGTPSVITTDISVLHKFLNAGIYNITLTRSHPEFGSKTTTNSITIKLRSLGVEICASGIINVDNCRIDDPNIATCDGVPLDATRTTFTVSGIHGCSADATYTYLWETLVDGSSWQVAGTASSFSSNRLNTARPMKSYQVRCTVTSSCGRVGIGTSMFLAYYSSPDCL